MDHKGSISLLISSLGINKLFHRNDSSYPTTETPQIPTQQLHMIPLRDWIEIKAGLMKCNIFYSPISPSRKPWSSHKCNRYFLFKMEHIEHSSSQDPQNQNTWAATQPLQKFLTHSSSPLCRSLQKTCKTSRPFLNILGVAEVQSSKFFRSNSPNQVLFLINYNTQRSKSSTHF
jgi:hypothetical protein